MTADGGLILIRELDERLGLEKLVEEHLGDSRGKNTQVALADLLRQPLYSHMAGYEDVNDAERLSQDLAGALHTDGGGCTLSVGREVKMEIPA